VSRVPQYGLTVGSRVSVLLIMRLKLFIIVLGGLLLDIFVTTLSEKLTLFLTQLVRLTSHHIVHLA
jgi:hypothetical protein